jgi:hypothetical protein
VFGGGEFSLEVLFPFSDIFTVVSFNNSHTSVIYEYNASIALALEVQIVS